MYPLGKLFIFPLFSLFSLVLLSLRKYIIFPAKSSSTPHAVFSAASEIRTSNMKNDLKRDTMMVQTDCGLSGEADIYRIPYFLRIIFCVIVLIPWKFSGNILISALFSLHLQCKSLPSGRWYEMSLSICITFTIDRIL